MARRPLRRHPTAPPTSSPSAPAGAVLVQVKANGEMPDHRVERAVVGGAPLRRDPGVGVARQPPPPALATAPRTQELPLPRPRRGVDRRGGDRMSPLTDHLDRIDTDIRYFAAWADEALIENMRAITDALREIDAWCEQWAESTAEHGRRSLQSGRPHGSRDLRVTTCAAPSTASPGAAMPRLLDLFSGAGGAAVGYARAGFEVVGVDNRPQPHYPYEFHQADAMTFPLDGFDAIHASPPCQDHSDLSSRVGKHGTGWMLDATRDRLTAHGAPYVIENVDSADPCPARSSCAAHPSDASYRTAGHYGGTAASNSAMWLMGPPCSCPRRILGVYGTGGPGGYGHGVKPTIAEARAADGHRLDDPRRARPGHPTRLHPPHRPTTPHPPPGAALMPCGPHPQHRRSGTTPPSST